MATKSNLKKTKLHRLVVYLNDDQLRTYQSLSDMLALGSSSAAAKHCMTIGLSSLRVQAASWEQSRAVDRLVSAVESAGDVVSDVARRGDS